MLNIESIFKERVFNKTFEPEKSVIESKEPKNISKLPKIGFDDYSYDIVGPNYLSLFGEEEDIDTYTREDEIGLFKSYKIGNIYADKFNNSYKITRRNDNTISYILNSHLDKYRKHEVSISRKTFLEIMQYNESYKQEWYAGRYIED